MDYDESEYEGGFLPVAWFFSAGLVVVLVVQVLWLIFVIAVLGFVLTPVVGDKVPAYGALVAAVYFGGFLLIPVVLPYAMGKKAVGDTKKSARKAGQGIGNVARNTRDMFM